MQLQELSYRQLAGVAGGGLDAKIDAESFVCGGSIPALPESLPLMLIDCTLLAIDLWEKSHEQPPTPAPETPYTITLEVQDANGEWQDAGSWDQTGAWTDSAWTTSLFTGGDCSSN